MKHKLRKHFLSLRNSLADKEVKDTIIRNKILTSNIYKECKSIFTYVNMGSEIDTIKIIEYSLSIDKIVAVPKITDNKTMIFVKINSLNELKIGKFNILEPLSCNELVSDDCTIFLIPGLVFDKENYRIGYGGGYYDKYLSSSKCLKKIGVAYSFQIIDSVPRDDFDIAVDYIIRD